MTEPFRGQVGHPDGLSFDKCDRQSASVTATCAAHGDRLIELDAVRLRPIWSRRLPLLLAEGRLVCAECRAPFSTLRVDGCRNGIGEGPVLATWRRG